MRPGRQRGGVASDGSRAVSIRRGRLRYPLLERRRVAAARDGDDDRVVSSVGRIVLVELRAQAPRFDADDGVEPRVVIVAAPENGHADYVLLYLVAFARERALDDVAQETAHAVGAREGGARQHAVELETNLVR